MEEASGPYHAAMTSFRLRTDLERAVVGDYALPLGLVPRELAPPTTGYTVEFIPGEDDDPDTYRFLVVVSHERIATLLDALFDLLPGRVMPILEIGSRDAYRTVDVYLGREPMPHDEFRAIWREYESFLIEDGSIAAGANAEDPLIEVFMDHWKSITVHATLTGRARVEEVLENLGLEEVGETWPEMGERDAMRAVEVRPILDLPDEFAPDVEELLLELRDAWDLELDDDPTANVDDAGRELGYTLWQALLILESRSNPDDGAYATIWATAASRSEMEDLVDDFLAEQRQWRFVDYYAMDRIAFDERPDELSDLPPRRDRAEVHLISCEPWASNGQQEPPPT